MSSKSKSADSAGAPNKGGKEAKSSRTSKPVPIQVVLEHGRNRHLSWIFFCVAIGLLFLSKLGTIGQAIGALLLLLALTQCMAAAKTFLHKPGSFNVTESEISVPTGLCSGKQLSLSQKQLEHAFFLRRAVPWNKAGPILVIEAEGIAYSFPRDWFASDSDQRRVAAALHHRLQSEASA